MSSHSQNARRKQKVPGKPSKQGALDVGPDAVDTVEKELDAASRHAREVAPDDNPKLDAMKEARRLHRDSFVVKSDLEDEEQREAAPGTRDQD